MPSPLSRLEASALAPVVQLARRAVRRVRPRALSPLEAQAAEYDRLTVAVAQRALHDGGTCVDAGANRGDLLAAFLQACPDARFVAFEPLPDLAKVLRRRCPQAEVLEVALSDQVGRATFRYLPDRPALSSLLVRPERERAERVVDLDVALDTLDRAVAPYRPVTFLKIDVEGAELPLLKGARAVLTEDRPVVVVECGPENLPAVGDELADAGYALWLIPDWLAGRPPFASTEAALEGAGSTEFQFVAAPRN